jgi:potassium-dependent mechanosensitive channel
MRDEAMRTHTAELATLRDEAKALIGDRKELLDRLSISQRTYLNTLDELVTAEDQLLSTAQDYRSLIDKALFWVPVAPLSERSFRDLPQTLRWLASPNGWRDVRETLEAQAQARSIQVLALLSAVLALLAVSKLIDAHTPGTGVAARPKPLARQRAKSKSVTRETPVTASTDA